MSSPTERTPGAGAAAVFLDRDGTIIVDADYLADPERVELLPGAAEAIRTLKEAGLRVVVVTNQSGIARGLHSEADYEAVASRVQEVLGARGAAPDATYHCPHHPDFTGPCECRKPGLGMHRAAERRFGLDLATSYYIGDKPSDVLPAAVTGGTGILVRTGYGRESESEVSNGTVVVDDLLEAARWVRDHLVDPSKSPG